MIGNTSGKNRGNGTKRNGVLLPFSQNKSQHTPLQNNKKKEKNNNKQTKKECWGCGPHTGAKEFGEVSAVAVVKGWSCRAPG